MLINHQQISKIKVFSIDGKRICHLKKVVFDFNTGKILAFLTNKKKSPYISVQDIFSLDSQRLVLSQEYEFNSIDDLFRVKASEDQKINLIGLKVKTESGQFLGCLNNYQIDSDNLILKNISVRQRFWFFFRGISYLIDHKNIVEISKTHLKVKDSWIKINILNQINQPSFQNQPSN